MSYNVKDSSEIKECDVGGDRHFMFDPFHSEVRVLQD
jgi:hypothetical protein